MLGQGRIHPTMWSFSPSISHEVRRSALPIWYPQFTTAAKSIGGDEAGVICACDATEWSEQLLQSLAPTEPSFVQLFVQLLVCSWLLELSSSLCQYDYALEKSIYTPW